MPERRTRVAPARPADASPKVRQKHEDRRQKIARIVTQAIAELGLEGVTVREVAARAGFSTTVVTHYFANKKELLLFTYQWISGQSYARVDAALRADPTDLLGLVLAIAYVDHPEYWKLYLAFWQMALTDRDFRQEQQRRADDVRRIVVALLQRRARAGLPVTALDVRRAARNLVLVVQGFGLQSVLHDKDWTRRDARNFLAEQVRLLTG